MKMGAKKGKAEEAVRVQKKEAKCVRDFQAHKGREPRFKGIALPYNKRIDLSAGGWHVSRGPLFGSFSLGESRASSPPGAGLPPSPCGPSSQVIRVLYGR
jgi:hypothetical protein